MILLLLLLRPLRSSESPLPPGLITTEWVLIEFYSKTEFARFLILFSD